MHLKAGAPGACLGLLRCWWVVAASGARRVAVLARGVSQGSVHFILLVPDLKSEQHRARDKHPVQLKKRGRRYLVSR